MASQKLKPIDYERARVQKLESENFRLREEVKRLTNQIDQRGSVRRAVRT